jgi:hypothetical protein
VGRQGEELLAEIRRKTEMCVDRVGNISSIERFVKPYGINLLLCFYPSLSQFNYLVVNVIARNIFINEN